MEENTLRVLGFTEFPGLRHDKISDNSGEEFYHKQLNARFHDSMMKNKKLTVVLDGVAGYAPSFIDEAFGNLVYDFTLNLVEKNLIVISKDESSWITMLETQTYPIWEDRRKKNDAPKKTMKDLSPWFRYIDGEYIKKNWIKPND